MPVTFAWEGAHAVLSEEPTPTASLIVSLGTVLSGCVFAAAQGADANVRYGLSNALVLTCALAVWALANVRDAGAEEVPGHDRFAVVPNPRERELVGSLASGA